MKDNPTRIENLSPEILDCICRALDEELLAQTYVDPPQLTRLGLHLGFYKVVRNQEEFLETLKS